MQQTAAQKTAADEPARKLRPRGRPWAPGQSGNPQGRRNGQRSKRFAVLYAGIVETLGGADKLIGINAALAEQAAQLLERAERAKDAAVAARCANSAQRLLANLCKRAPQRDDEPRLEDYLASQYGRSANATPPDQEAEAAECADAALAREVAVDGDTATSGHKAAP
jgi:hypothetical protein